MYGMLAPPSHQFSQPQFGQHSFWPWPIPILANIHVGQLPLWPTLSSANPHFGPPSLWPALTLAMQPSLWPALILISTH